MTGFLIGGRIGWALKRSNALLLFNAIHNFPKKMFPVFGTNGNKIGGNAAIIPELQTGRWYTVFGLKFN